MAANKKMRSLLPYARASRLSSEFLPVGDVPAVDTTCRRTMRAGARLEQQQTASNQAAEPAVEARAFSLFNDGGHVRPRFTVVRFARLRRCLARSAMTMANRSCSAICPRRPIANGTNCAACYMGLERRRAFGRSSKEAYGTHCGGRGSCDMGYFLSLALRLTSSGIVPSAGGKTQKAYNSHSGPRRVSVAERRQDAAPH